MRNIAHKATFSSLLAAVLILAGGDALSERRAASASIATRIGAAPSHGVGTVIWGAVVQLRSGAPSLFVYGVNQGRGLASPLRVCSEMKIEPGRKIFFVASTDRSPGCGKNSVYASVDGSAGVIFPVYVDSTNSETWLRLPSAYIENFGCKDIRTIVATMSARKGDDSSRVDVFGIPGGGTYVSGNDVFHCLVSKGVDLSGAD